jgi:hypothetical protein
MSNYTKTTNFAVKDLWHLVTLQRLSKAQRLTLSLTTLQTAVATKSDTASPTFTGTVTIPNCLRYCDYWYD